MRLSQQLSYCASWTTLKKQRLRLLEINQEMIPERVQTIKG